MWEESWGRANAAFELGSQAFNNETESGSRNENRVRHSLPFLCRSYRSCS
jgi:hypothetical protein